MAWEDAQVLNKWKSKIMGGGNWLTRSHGKMAVKMVFVLYNQHKSSIIKETT